jgi:hypothetical protein
MALSLAVRWTSDNGIPYDLPGVTSVDISKGEGLENNSCSINLRNDSTELRQYLENGGIVFRTNQSVDVFVRYDTDGEELDDYNFDYLVFSGRIVELDCDTTDKGSPLKLKCADSSYIALNRVWLGVESGTPPVLIKNIIGFVNQNMFDPNRTIVAQIEQSLTAISTAGVVTATAHSIGEGTAVVLYDTNSTPSADGRWIASGVTANTFQLKNRVTGAYPAFSVAGTSGTIGGIQALNSSGGAYTSGEISKTGAPAYEIIKQLSQPIFTGETSQVPNRFHVDKWNSIRWFYPDDTVGHVIREGATAAETASYFHPVNRTSYTVTDTRAHSVVSIKMTYAVYDIVNFIIYKAGQDLDNVQIQYFAYKDGTGTPENKDSLRNWEDIARELKRQEATIGNLTFSKNDEYTIAVTSGTTSWGESYSSSSDYKEKFIVRAQTIAQWKAQAIFDKTGNPRWTGSIELRGEHSFDVNDYIVFTSLRHGINNVFMRIKSVKHNISKTGWFTTIDVNEEVPRSTL